MKLRITLLAAAIAALASGPARAQTQVQYPFAPWNAYAPSVVECGSLIGANFNVTTDQAIPISVPSALYAIDAIAISNPSVSLSTAAGGFYTAASKGGIAVVANSQAYSGLTTNTANATGNYLKATLATAGNTTAFNGFAQTSQISTLYLSLTTAQGAAATADVRVYCRLLY